MVALRRKWDEGGRYRVAMHTVAGAMSGGVAGAASAATFAGSANQLGELQSHIQAALKNAGASESLANITSQAAAAGLGGAAERLLYSGLQRRPCVVG